MIEGAADGFGAPIGSHYVPGAPGYVDTTGVNPFNIEKAKQLLAEAGVKTPLELTMTLPPPPYARQGGEVIAAAAGQDRHQREDAERRMGAVAQRHLRQQGLRPHHRFARRALRPGQLRQARLLLGLPVARSSTTLYDKIKTTANAAERNKLLGDAQKLLATDAANGFLYQPQFPTIAKKGVKGLWKDMPIFVNDLSALSWS